MLFWYLGLKESLESMEVDNYNTYLYAHGGHIGHVTLIIYKHIGFSFLYKLNFKFSFDWPRGFREKDL